MKVRRKNASGRPLQRVAIGIGMPLMLLGAAFSVLAWDRALSGAASFCLIHELTGLFCIGCGGSRALAALLNGNFRQAVGHNLFIFVWLPVAAYGLLAIWLSQVSGRWLLPPLQAKRWMMILLLLSAILFLVGRNLAAAPFSFLAP